MKKLSIALLAIAAVGGQAQLKETWQNTQIDSNLSTRTLGTAVTFDAATLVLSVMEDGDLRLTKYSETGSQMWVYRITGANANPVKPAGLKVDAEGNALLSYTTNANTAIAAKIDDLGAPVWSKTIPTGNQLFDFAVDGQNAFVALCENANGPLIFKCDAAGNQVALTSLNSPGYTASSLSVAGNGLIYLSARKAATSYNYIYSYTPNGTSRFSVAWENAKPAYVAADRNGRLTVAELDGAVASKAHIYNFSAAGVPTRVDVDLAANANALATSFDSNGRFLLAASVQPMGGQYVNLALDTFNVTDTTATNINRAEVKTGWNHTLTGLTVDAFGQAYITARRSGAIEQGVIYAFDDRHSLNLWWYADQNGTLGYMDDVRGAVGRWGQLSLATTLGTMRLYEGVTGLRQKGFRNLTINGQSFTGGRTITGTVSFYSNDTVDRTVALSSSQSNYAVVTPSAKVLKGTSQTGMSIELKPTNVRRAIAIEGNFNGTYRRVTFYIEPPVAASVTLFPTTAKGGKVVNATARLNGIAPTSGITGTLTSDKACAPVPANVTFAGGEISKGFTIATTPVATTQSATITFVAGEVTKTAALMVTP